MCLHQTTFPNKSKGFVSYRDLALVSVPCGQCPECRSKYRNSWRLRIYREMMATSKVGGKSFFILLTYKPSKRPKFKLYGKEIFGFDSTHIKKFRRDLVDYLHDHYSIDYGNVSYLVASEYGTTANRDHAPHYHVILHIHQPNVNISDVDVRLICNRLWSSYLYTDFNGKKKLVGQGNGLANPYRRRSDGTLEIPKLEVDNLDIARASRYISKYITKDLMFYNQPLIQKFLQEFAEAKSMLSKAQRKLLDDNLDKLPVDALARRYVHFKKLYNKIKKHFPKHWQSNGYGLDLINDVLTPNGINIDPILNGYRVDKLFGDKTSISMPQYILNKLFYTFDDKKRRVLTPLGIDLKLKLFDFQLVKFSDIFKQLYDINYVVASADGTTYDFSELRSKLIKSHITSFDLAKYKLLYHNRPISDDDLQTTDCKERYLSMLSLQHPDDTYTICDFYEKEPQFFYGNEVFSYLYNAKYPLHAEAVNALSILQSAHLFDEKKKQQDTQESLSKLKPFMFNLIPNQNVETQTP